MSEILRMCHPQASAASAHQVNCVLQVNFARCVTHEEAALMPARTERSIRAGILKNLCVKKNGLYNFNRITCQFIKLDKVGISNKWQSFTGQVCKERELLSVH